MELYSVHIGVNRKFSFSEAQNRDLKKQDEDKKQDVLN